MQMRNEHKDANELAKVLWYYNLIPNVSSGTQKIVCPFHKDVNPSMIVNFEDGSFFCFGCNLTGDAFKFVKLMEKDLNDLQALKKFRDILKSKKCSDVKIAKNTKKTKKVKRELYDQAYDYYHGLSKVNWGKVKSEEIKVARDYMFARGFKPSTLNNAKAKYTYNDSYLLIFPMLDNGKFKGWVCRTTVKRIEEKRKYLYNEGFSRATTLVGDYGDKDYVFVVEGYMDRLKFIQNGENNVVAILGWKMSSEQIKKLKDKGITKIISALDNDECGKKGTKYLKEFFDVTRFKYLKSVKDPGEMSKKLFDKMYTKTIESFNKKYKSNQED